MAVKYTEYIPKIYNSPELALAGGPAVSKPVPYNVLDDKKLLMQINTEVDKVFGSNEGTGNVNLKNIDEFIDGTKTFDDVVDDFARLYSEKIQTNKTWSWNKSFHGGDKGKSNCRWPDS